MNPARAQMAREIPIYSISKLQTSRCLTFEKGTKKTVAQFSLDVNSLIVIPSDCLLFNRGIFSNQLRISQAVVKAMACRPYNSSKW